MAVLPKFKVSVELPPYFLVNKDNPSRQSDLMFRVSAKYVCLINVLSAYTTKFITFTEKVVFYPTFVCLSVRNYSVSQNNTPQKKLYVIFLLTVNLGG